MRTAILMLTGDGRRGLKSFPPADTMSNVSTSGRRGLEFARLADHRCTVNSFSMTCKAAFRLARAVQETCLYIFIRDIRRSGQ